MIAIVLSGVRMRIRRKRRSWTKRKLLLRIMLIMVLKMRRYMMFIMREILMVTMIRRVRWRPHLPLIVKVRIRRPGR
jgi:hypothetical protein